MLYQADFIEENTIYVIRYDFTLGEDITVPANCVLEFDGGSLSGEYTLTGSNTGIKAGLVKILGTDVTLSGTWMVKEAYPEWFGAIPLDYTIDNGIYINRCLKFFDNVKISEAKFYVNSTVYVGGGKHLYGGGNASKILVIGNVDLLWLSRGAEIDHLQIVAFGVVDGTDSWNPDAGIDDTKYNHSIFTLSSESCDYLESLGFANSVFTQTYIHDIVYAAMHKDFADSDPSYRDTMFHFWTAHTLNDVTFNTKEIYNVNVYNIFQSARCGFFCRGYSHRPTGRTGSANNFFGNVLFRDCQFSSTFGFFSGPSEDILINEEYKKFQGFHVCNIKHCQCQAQANGAALTSKYILFYNGGEYIIDDLYPMDWKPEQYKPYLVVGDMGSLQTLTLCIYNSPIEALLTAIGVVDKTTDIEGYLGQYITFTSNKTQMYDNPMILTKSCFVNNGQILTFSVVDSIPSAGIIYNFVLCNQTGKNTVVNMKIVNTTTAYFTQSDANMVIKPWVQQRSDNKYLIGIYVGENIEGVIIGYMNQPNYINNRLWRIGNGTTAAGTNLLTSVTYNYPHINWGTTRPTIGLCRGYQFFDLNLHKPIWYTWKEQGGWMWVDSNGTAV